MSFKLSLLVCLFLPSIGIAQDLNTPIKRISSSKPVPKPTMHNIPADITMGELKQMEPRIANEFLKTTLYKELGSHINFNLNRTTHMFNRHIQDPTAEHGFETLQFEPTLALTDLVGILKNTFENGDKKIGTDQKSYYNEEDSNLSNVFIRTLIHNECQYTLVTKPPLPNQPREFFVTFFPSSLPISPQELATTTLGSLNNTSQQISSGWLHSLLTSTFENTPLRIPFNRVFITVQNFISGYETTNSAVLFPAQLPLTAFADLLLEVWKTPPFFEGQIFKNTLCLPVISELKASKRECRIFWDKNTQREYLLTTLRYQKQSSTSYFEKFFPITPEAPPPEIGHTRTLKELPTLGTDLGLTLLFYALKKSFVTAPLNILHKSLDVTYQGLVEHLAQNPESPLGHLTFDQWSQHLYETYFNSPPQPFSIESLKHTIQNYNKKKGALIVRDTTLNGQQSYFITQKHADDAYETFHSFLLFNDPELESQRISNTPISQLTSYNWDRLTGVFHKLLTDPSRLGGRLTFPKNQLRYFLIANVFKETPTISYKSKAFEEDQTPLDMVSTLQSVFMTGVPFEYPQVSFGVGCPPPSEDVRYRCRMGADPKGSKTHIIVTTVKFSADNTENTEEFFDHHFAKFHSMDLWNFVDAPLRDLTSLSPEDVISLFHNQIRNTYPDSSLLLSFSIAQRLVYHHIFQKEVPQINREDTKQWPPYPQDFSLTLLVKALGDTYALGTPMASGETKNGILCPTKEGKTTDITCKVLDFEGYKFMLMTVPHRNDATKDNVLKFHLISPP